MIRIHNSLTGEKQELEPVEPGHVRMYSCGLTVYDYFHVGNARMLVVFDMVSRYLRYRGLRVTYVRNITDVDDKIINRAKEAGVDWRAHAAKYISAMHEDLDRLGCLRPEKEPKASEYIDEMLASVKGGDIRRGQALFNSEKTACAACHAIGYLGGKVGPDLTRIGQVRNERDLLEAIVYPDVSFVRSYESIIVSTKSGDEYSGVLRQDAPDEIVLATGPTTEQRIPRNDVADMRPGTVSVMPSGLADQLTKEELADLLAFLRATRW